MSITHTEFPCPWLNAYDFLGFLDFFPHLQELLGHFPEQEALRLPVLDPKRMWLLGMARPFL